MTSYPSSRISRGRKSPLLANLFNDGRGRLDTSFIGPADCCSYLQPHFGDPTGRNRPVFGNPPPAKPVPRSPTGDAVWTKRELKETLARYGLPKDMPLSVLAVGTLPEPNGWFDDPLGGDLGQVRILRTSSLIPIEGGCCVS